MAHGRPTRPGAAHRQPPRRSSADPPIRLRWDRIAWLLAVLVLTVVATRTAMTAPTAAEAAEPPAATVPVTVPAATMAGVGDRSAGACPAEGAVVRSAPGYGRTVALTFDDGPGEWTDDVLRVLAEHDVPAAFFVVGRAVEAHPDLVRDIAGAGHLVANHTWNHEPPPPGDAWPASYVDTEITPTAVLLREVTGADPCWYRPPLGVTHGIDHEAATRPLDIALWSVDSLDWKIQSGASEDPDGSLAAEVTARATVGIGQPNPLVLLHDGGGWRGATVAALPGIIEAYRDAGYRFVRLDESLRSGPGRA